MQGILTGIGPTAAAYVRAAQARLRRTTRRERLLLLVLGLGALIYAPILVMNWRAEQEDRYVEALTERSSARLARGAARRIAASTPDQAAVEDMRTWGFEASNLAVARVGIEQQLFNDATRAGLTNILITTDEAPETIGPTQWLGAQVQADLKWGPTFAFLDALTGWPEGFRVKQFQYETTTNQLAPDIGFTPVVTGRVRIGLSVPVVTTDPASVAGPAA